MFSPFIGFCLCWWQVVLVVVITGYECYQLLVAQQKNPLPLVLLFLAVNWAFTPHLNSYCFWEGEKNPVLTFISFALLAVTLMGKLYAHKLKKE